MREKIEGFLADTVFLALAVMDWVWELIETVLEGRRERWSLTRLRHCHCLDTYNLVRHVRELG